MQNPRARTVRGSGAVDRRKGTAKVVLQPSTHDTARTPNEALPVLKLYYNPAQSMTPNEEAFSVLRLYDNQAHSSQDPSEAFPVLRLYYNQAKSREDPEPDISSTKVVPQPQPNTIRPGP